MDDFPERLQHVAVDGRRIAAVRHVTTEKRIVLMCHGFRGHRLGPNRFFVRLARRLQAMGVGSVRFDQFGSGDSERDFRDSSFDDWVATTSSLARRFRAGGYQVALLGQGMGARRR